MSHFFDDEQSNTAPEWREERIHAEFMRRLEADKHIISYPHSQAIERISKLEKIDRYDIISVFDVHADAEDLEEILPSKQKDIRDLAKKYPALKSHLDGWFMWYDIHEALFEAVIKKESSDPNDMEATNAFEADIKTIQDKLIERGLVKDDKAASDECNNIIRHAFMAVVLVDAEHHRSKFHSKKMAPTWVARLANDSAFALALRSKINEDGEFSIHKSNEFLMQRSYEEPFEAIYATINAELAEKYGDEIGMRMYFKAPYELTAMLDVAEPERSNALAVVLSEYCLDQFCRDAEECRKLNYDPALWEAHFEELAAHLKIATGKIYDHERTITEEGIGHPDAPHTSELLDDIDIMKDYTLEALHSLSSAKSQRSV